MLAVIVTPIAAGSAKPMAGEDGALGNARILAARKSTRVAVFVSSTAGGTGALNLGVRRPPIAANSVESMVEGNGALTLTAISTS